MKIKHIVVPVVALGFVLSGCSGTETSSGARPEQIQSEKLAETQPQQPPVAEPPVTVTSTVAPAEVYHEACADARAKGMTDIPSWAPGYRLELDRDRDGIACESKPETIRTITRTKVETETTRVPTTVLQDAPPPQIVTKTETVTVTNEPSERTVTETTTATERINVPGAIVTETVTEEIPVPVEPEPEGE